MWSVRIFMFFIFFFHWNLTLQDVQETIYFRNHSIARDFSVDNRFQIDLSRRSIELTISTAFYRLIIFFTGFYDIFINSLFYLLYIFRGKQVSKPKNILVFESAVSLAQKIREGDVTSEQVVQAFIERIKEVNGLINAVTDNRFESAINEAKTIDKDIESGKTTEDDFKEKPFLGVPFTATELIACEGMKFTLGLVCRKNFIANEDADVIKLVKEAGGILLGVTNVPQLGWWEETSNPIYGTTNNPFDTSKTVGGSSGGEAAIIASFGSPISIGVDIGGSIRMPAFMCGLFAHKPTNDLISNKGIMYKKGYEGLSITTVGPTTKQVEDIIPLLKVLLQDNVKKLKLDEHVNVNQLQIYYMLECGDILVSGIGLEMRRIILKTIGYFQKISIKPPQLLSLPNIKYGGKLWRYWMTQESEKGFETDLACRQGKVNVFWEILKLITFGSDYTAGTILNLFYNLFPQENENWARELTVAIRNELVQTLGNNSVLIYPSSPWAASHHSESLFRPWNFYYYAVWNALKMPVTQVPISLDYDNLPIGIQVVCAPYQDHLCIAVAKELEEQFGGYIPSFDIDSD